MDPQELENTERVGFEPTDSFSIKRFRVVRFRPLSHLSVFKLYIGYYLFISKILIISPSLPLSLISVQVNYFLQDLL